MPKIKLDPDALKGFFVLHVEKIVLVVVLLLFVVFVYNGYSLEGLPSDRTPDALQEFTDKAEENMRSDTWAIVASEHTPPSGFEESAKQSAVATTDLPYQLSKPLMPSTRPSGVKRIDPELLPPQYVEATVVIGAVAYQMEKGEEDPLMDQKDSEQIVKKAKRKRPRRKKKGYAEMMMAGYGDDDGGAGGDGYAEMMADMLGDYGAAMGGDADSASRVRADSKSIIGFRPQAGSYGAIPKAKAIVAVKAVVPYLAQWDAYDEAFYGAMDYNPRRDVPKYLTFSAQRAEVPADPNAELKWVRIANTNTEMDRLRREKWAGVPGEIADPSYTSPGVLTMPMPPVMLRKLEELALHSLIPQLKPATTALAKNEVEAEIDIASDGPLDDLPGELPLGGPGGPMGAGGYAAAMEALQGDQGYATSADTSGEDMGYGGADMAAMMAQFMGGGLGGGSASGAMAMVRAERPDNEYLLIRFFDFTAMPDRKYRYRVQVLIEDPNHPENSAMDPRERSLEDVVRERLTDVLKQENGSEKRVYYLRTDWSEPSDVVDVQMPRNTLAGPITQPRTITVPDTQFTIPATEPSAKVMAVVFDPTRAVDVPAVVNAYRGTTLNVKQNADVLHPVNLQFKVLEEFSVTTHRMLVDFRGGFNLPMAEKEDKGKKGDDAEEEEPLTAPGEFIFLDEDGNFFLKNEMEDEPQFSMYAVPVIVEAAGKDDDDKDKKDEKDKKK